jgi:hypothetical protein
MRKPLLTFLFSVAVNVLLQAQFITHGPVIGAVSPESCKMYLRTAVPASIEIELSTSLKFLPEKSFKANITNANGQSVMVTPLLAQVSTCAISNIILISQKYLILSDHAPLFGICNPELR